MSLALMRPKENHPPERKSAEFFFEQAIQLTQQRERVSQARINPFSFSGG